MVQCWSCGTRTARERRFASRSNVSRRSTPASWVSFSTVCPTRRGATATATGTGTGTDLKRARQAMHDAVQHTTADVAAVIVAFNDAALVRSGAAAAVASGVNRVLVWDNSTDPTVREQIRGLANDRILVLSLGANVGFGSANNRAMELVDEPLVLLVNPDCSITSDALET